MDAQAIKTMREARFIWVTLKDRILKDVNPRALKQIDAMFALLDAEAARGDRMRDALETIASQKVPMIIPWTHEAAADAFSRMLDRDRSIARAALEGEA